MKIQSQTSYAPSAFQYRLDPLCAMNLPLMLIPLILPRPPPLRSFATHDPALKAMKRKMLAFVMSTKIVETSKVRVAVLVGTKKTTFRSSAEFRGLVGRWATRTILENFL